MVRCVGSCAGPSSSRGLGKRALGRGRQTNNAQAVLGEFIGAAKGLIFSVDYGYYHNVQVFKRHS